MRKSAPQIVVLIILLVAGYFIFKPNMDENYSQTNYYLGTVNTVTVYGKKQKKAMEILNGCDEVVKVVDNLMSTEIPGSDVSKINKNAGIKPVKVSPETYEVVKEAIKYSKLSDGNFDVSIGPVSDLWSIEAKEIKLETDQDGDGKNETFDKEYTVFLKKKGMKIDLGAIAKGFAADQVALYLKASEVEKAIINLGGNIKTIGDFNIGLKNPIENANDSFASVRVSNKSVVTSGVYERFVEKDGKKYHHILNPADGYPFDNNLLSVSIISDKSINCDALSTSAFALGLEDGKKMIESIDNVEAVFVTKDKKVYLTKGFKDEFEILNDDFTVVK